MPPPSRRPIHVAGIIERHDNHILIQRGEQKEDGTSWWRFPRGAARPDESPEEAMRRIARDTLGIEVEIVVGQPPMIETVEGTSVELRYFFCGVIQGEPRSSDGGELRWVSRLHLREYDFDGPSRAVVEWLLENP